MREEDRQREQRQEPRFETQMWVGIQDTEGDSEVERCNISASGMLLRTSRDVGEPGVVRMLRLVTSDLAAVVEVMSRVVRVEASQHRETGALERATAFEFLLHRPEELKAFLDIALASRLVGELPKDDLEIPEGPAPITKPEGPLQVTRLALEADRALEPGTRVRLEVQSAAGRTDWLTGFASHSQPVDEIDRPGVYRVEIELGSDGGGATESHGPMYPGQDRKIGHLSGMLSEIGIAGLLGFFELEHASGVLRLEHDSRRVSLFVRDGAIVDVDSDQAETPALDSLRTLLAWTRGSFEFTFQAVERPNVLRMSTTAILMECARLQDEASRNLG